METPQKPDLYEEHGMSQLYKHHELSYSESTGYRIKDLGFMEPIFDVEMIYYTKEDKTFRLIAIFEDTFDEEALKKAFLSDLYSIVQYEDDFQTHKNALRQFILMNYPPEFIEETYAKDETVD